MFATHGMRGYGAGEGEAQLLHAFYMSNSYAKRCACICDIAQSALEPGWSHMLLPCCALCEYLREILCVDLAAG